MGYDVGCMVKNSYKFGVILSAVEGSPATTSCAHGWRSFTTLRMTLSVMKGSLLLLLLLLPTMASAKSLIADISDHLINIDSKFTGADILLFGARNDPGDIVVVLRGPKHSYIVRKKERVAGIWVNRSQVRFDEVDSFYTVAASRPIYAINGDSLLPALAIGINNLPFTVVNKPKDLDIEPYKNALLEWQADADLYYSSNRPITFMGEILFRTVIRFPDIIPRGDYTAETYLVNNGQILAAQSTPIQVKKVGFDAFVSDMAHDYAALYGLVAVSMALIAGWFAGFIFRKL